MRMSAQLYRELENTITGILREKPDALVAYKEGRFPRSEKAKDYHTRFRWDLFYAALRRNSDLITPLLDAENLADAHIDTALRRIVPAF